MTVMSWSSVQPGDLDWQQFSKCKDTTEPELFHPESHKRDDQEAQADQVAASWCRLCPVVAACRAFAEERGAVGVWGGTLRSIRGAEPRVVELPSMQPRPASSSCGTTAGYHRHKRRSEMPCTACYEARAASLADRRRRISSERESA